MHALDEEDEEFSLTTEENKQHSNLKSLIFDIISREETFWWQRSRDWWIKDGDHNTKFFHIPATNRKRKNEIFTIFVNGQQVLDLEKIHEDFFTYFTSLIRMGNSGLCEVDWKRLYPKSPLDLKLLESPFSKDQIRHALFSLAKNKAPGLDHEFPISFYQYFWKTLKPNIINLFMGLSIGTVDISRLYYNYIALILNKTDRPTVKDYRPICLEHGFIKLLSKVPSIKLNRVMKSLVYSSESAFIKGCLIIVSFASVSKIINYVIKSMSPGILLKINFEKSFNSIF